MLVSRLSVQVFRGVNSLPVAIAPIYIKRLQAGEIDSFEETLDSSFLDVEEPELKFVGPVRIAGVASVAGEHLVLQFDLVQVTALMPCRVCDQETEVIVRLEHLSHAEEVAKHPAGIFDCGPLLRELILVEVPQFAECGPSGCPSRQELKKYFRK